MRITATLLCGILIYGCSSGAELEEEEPERPQLPPFSFLLPAPGGDPELTLRLFSAPVLNLARIEQVARQYEARSRALLLQRQAELVSDLCDQTSDAREERLGHWEDLQSRQFTHWKSYLANYESSLEYQLRKDRNPDNPEDEGLINEALEARETVTDLQVERQKLIQASWDQFFQQMRDWQDSGVDYCVGAPTDSKTDRPAYEAQPRELLYLPYYISLYRFFRIFPPEERSRLILALHASN